MKKNLKFPLIAFAALPLLLALAGCADNGAGDASSLSSVYACSVCGGTGTVGGSPCDNCSGTGDYRKGAPGSLASPGSCPCCDTEGCTGGISCTACDECEECMDEDCCGEGACTECTTCSECEKTTIDLSYIGSFLQGISSTIAAYDGATVGWQFGSNSTWNGSAATFTMGSYGDKSSDSPNISDVLGAVRRLGSEGVVTSSDELVEITFGSVTWDSTPTPGSATGSITVTVELSDAAQTGGGLAGTYEIGSDVSDLESSGLTVTLVFNVSAVSSVGWTACSSCNNCSVASGCTGRPGCSACSTNNCNCEDCQKTTVDKGYVGSFLRSLSGQIPAYLNATAGWTLAGGEWDGNSSDGYTFTVGLPNSASNQPSIGGTLDNVQALSTQTATDGSCSIAFGSVTGWDSSSAPTASSDDDGEITVTVTALTGYEVPSGLESVTIVLDPNTTTWAD